MRKITSLIAITISLTVLFYPQVTIGKLTGSPGGKTGSPMDNSDCTQCHSGSSTGASVSIITSNIPSSGYIPGAIYNITAVINNGFSGDPKGFEITCEEITFNTKTGAFLITNPNSTQFVNNNTSVTHTTAGNTLNSWNFDWEAPESGTGDITFYGAFIEAGYPFGSNLGDNYYTTTLLANENIINTTNNLSNNNNHIYFNSITKTIKLLNSSNMSIYNLEGKLVRSINKNQINLADLSKGTYIIKTENNTKKIVLN